ncbi:MAG: hypothetical protein JW795_14910 [Chitinivibrionales bacterium]|nr:hypothetical protein [Chitinivibrionales bacterium]
MRNRTQIQTLHTALITGLFSFFIVAYPVSVYSHCDSMDGPVIITAKKALEKGSVTDVLKWVNKEYENEIRTLFAKTVLVRAKGAEAKELADMHFFETLVRLHRAGEGAPYTGLKPAGSTEPVVVLSDKGLEIGNPDELIKTINEHSAAGIREKFQKALEAKKHAQESIEKGREYVEAYVVYTHYAEGIHNSIASEGEHHGDAEMENHTEEASQQHHH